MEKQKLQELTIEIIQTCPNNCIFCSSDSNMTKTNKISLEEFKSIIDSAKTLGVKYIYISGGEPLLHNDLLEILKYSKENGLTVYLYTSGIGEDKKSISLEFAKQLNKTGIDKIIFDIQTTKEEHYNLLMGTKNFLPSVYVSIRNIVNEGIDTEIHFVPNKINQNDIEDLLGKAKELGVKQVNLLRLVPQGRVLDNTQTLLLSDEEEINFKSKIQVLKEKHKEDMNIRIGIPLEDNKSNCHKCKACGGKLVVRYDGLVYPCEAYKFVDSIMYETAFIEGDIATPDSIRVKNLKDIYDNSIFLKIISDDVRRFHSKNAKTKYKIMLINSRNCKFI